MEKIDALDIFFKAEDGIRFYWQFYVVGITVLFGWLISLKYNLTWQVKLLVSIPFLLFMVMNIDGLLKSYEIMDAAQKDISNMQKIGISSTKSTEISQSIDCILKMWYPKPIVWWLHGIIDIIILALLWGNVIWEKQRKNKHRLNR